eukprot:1113312-Prymnesium_polylepis.1
MSGLFVVVLGHVLSFAVACRTVLVLTFVTPPLRSAQRSHTDTVRAADVQLEQTKTFSCIRYPGDTRRASCDEPLPRARTGQARCDVPGSRRRLGDVWECWADFSGTLHPDSNVYW